VEHRNGVPHERNGGLGSFNLPRKGRDAMGTDVWGEEKGKLIKTVEEEEGLERKEVNKQFRSCLDLPKGGVKGIAMFDWRRTLGQFFQKGSKEEFSGWPERIWKKQHNAGVREKGKARSYSLWGEREGRGKKISENNREEGKDR